MWNVRARVYVYRHVPYRNSLLTCVLRDSLGGNCHTAMVATASLEDEHLDETISTCKFAQVRRRRWLSVHARIDVNVCIFLHFINIRCSSLRFRVRWYVLTISQYFSLS